VRSLVCLLLTAYLLVVVVRVAMSWFPLSPDGVAAQVYRFTVGLTEPILGPLRRALPALRIGAGAIDLSPIVVFFGIQVLQAIIC
jgi:YggT family protein